EYRAARRPGRETSDMRRLPPPCEKVYRNRWREQTMIRALGFPIWQADPWPRALRHNFHSDKIHRKVREARPWIEGSARRPVAARERQRDNPATPYRRGPTMPAIPNLAARAESPVAARLPPLSTFSAAS